MRVDTSWAIVPVKTLTHAKRRLASHLPAAARRQLVLTMLEDVLAALAASAAVGRVLVVSPDAHVAELAAARGAMVLREGRAGAARACAALRRAAYDR